MDIVIALMVASIPFIVAFLADRKADRMWREINRKNAQAQNEQFEAVRKARHAGNP